MRLSKSGSQILATQKFCGSQPTSTCRLGYSARSSPASGQPLAEAAREKARLRTDVYRQRDDGAAQIIDRIIAVNDGDPSTTARAPAHSIGRLTTSP